MAILSGIVKAVIEADTSDIRFERFCIEIYNESEGTKFVTTSRSWDQGRDGRTIHAGDESELGIICCSLNSNVDAKVEKDINRILKTTKCRTLVFCSSRNLSEHRCDQIKSNIQEIDPSIQSIVVIGLTQLVDLSMRYEDIVSSHYRSEIELCEETLLVSPKASQDAEDIGLRLAMMTQSTNSAQELKDELTKRLLVDALYQNSANSPADIAKHITKILHLPRAVNIGYIEAMLRQLEEQGQVELGGANAELTAKGIEAVEAVPAVVSARLLEGRSAVRKAIKELSGHDLLDSHFDKVWSVIQDGLSQMFYADGMAIVRSTAAMLGSETADEKSHGIPIESLADRVVPLFADPTMGDEVRQAIIDMFGERESGI